MEKEEFVVDASIIAKWFLNEKNSPSALRVRDDFATKRISLSAPALLFYEVTNALRFSGTFNESHLLLATASFTKYEF